MELQANLGDFGQLLVTFGDLGKPSNWQNDQLTTDRQMDLLSCVFAAKNNNIKGVNKVSMKFSRFSISDVQSALGTETQTNNNF